VGDDGRIEHLLQVRTEAGVVDVAIGCDHRIRAIGETEPVECFPYGKPTRIGINAVLTSSGASGVANK
jgi:hypothetical protein